jgi:hypothetical protein
MKPGGHGAATQPADPSSIDPTRTSEPQPAAPPAHAPPPGQRPSGPAKLRDPERYQIIGEHGRGGLGRVSRAHDHDLGRDIAIKELISRGQVSEVRFLREALITARLEHPGIVPIYEAGRWPDGTPFYAMKLVAGRPLRELIISLSMDGTIARTSPDGRSEVIARDVKAGSTFAYAASRHLLAYVCDPGDLCILEIATGKRSHAASVPSYAPPGDAPPGHAPIDLSFSPDESQLAVLSETKDLRVLDVSGSGQPVE